MVPLCTGIFTQSESVYNGFGRMTRSASITCWGVLLSSISVVAPTGSAEDATLERAVCEAAERGSLNSVRRLHQSGARLQARDNEALCRACENGHLEVVRYLHEMGAELNARDDEPLCRACEGATFPSFDISIKTA